MCLDEDVKFWITVCLPVLLTGIFGWLAGIWIPLQILRRKSKRISKFLDLSIEPIPVLSEEDEDSFYRRFDLKLTNDSQFGITDLQIFVTIDYEPKDLAHSIYPRRIDYFDEQPRPTIDEPVYLEKGGENYRTIDIQPGGIATIPFVALRNSRVATKSPEYVRDDMIHRSLTVGLAPEGHKSLVELQRGHVYVVFLRVVSNDSDPLYFEITINPMQLAMPLKNLHSINSKVAARLRTTIRRRVWVKPKI